MSAADSAARARTLAHGPQAARRAQVHVQPPASAVLFFDGDCLACNRFCRWLAQQPARGPRLRFAPLQGAAGQAVLRRMGAPTEGFDSMVLLDRGQLLEDARAFAGLGRLHRGLAGGLRLLAWLPQTPVSALYRWLGRRRHLLGSASCAWPDPARSTPSGLSPQLEREIVLWASLPGTASAWSGSPSGGPKHLGMTPNP